MLRWVFGALVLLNIGLAMWANWYAGGGDAPVAAPRPPINPEAMRLVTDPAARLLARTPDVPPTDKVLAEVQRVCHAVGPFDSSKSATEAGSQIKGAGLDYRLRTESIKEKRFQVYIGPLPSIRVAAAVQQRLNRLGFRDHALIREGDLKNAVSVGVFEQKANADQVKKRLARHNIRTRSQVRELSRERYWLDVDAGDDILESLRAIRWRNPDAIIVENACSAGGETRKPGA